RLRACSQPILRSKAPRQLQAPSIASAIVELGNLGSAAVAVVAIGSPVAAADWSVFTGAHLRRPHAGAIDVGGVAEPDAVVAEQPFAACEANDGTADRPFGAAASRSLFTAARLGRDGPSCHDGKGGNEG